MLAGGRKSNAERYFVQEGIIRPSGNSGAVYVPAEYIGMSYELRIKLDKNKKGDDDDCNNIVGEKKKTV